MATITREISIGTNADAAWDAVRDVGAVHRRLVPGLVTNVTLEPEARIVMFANGVVVREWIVSIDDEHRRVCYAIEAGQSLTGGIVRNHSASMQIIPDGPDRCRFIWIADFLPDGLAEPMTSVIDMALPIIRETLEKQPLA